jgi:hypothetical protein
VSARPLAVAVSLWWAAGVVLPARADSGDLDQLMAALARRQHGHVTFVEEKHIALLDRPVKSSGELFYDAPDRLEKRTLTPKPETLLLEHGVLTAQRGRHHYVLDLNEYPQVVPFIESIRATLAGDRTALERVFRVAFEGPLENWTLSLTPRDAALGRTVREIHLAGHNDTVQRVEILETDGDSSVLTIGGEIAP